MARGLAIPGVVERDPVAGRPGVDRDPRARAEQLQAELVGMAVRVAVAGGDGLDDRHELVRSAGRRGRRIAGSAGLRRARRPSGGGIEPPSSSASSVARPLRAAFAASTRPNSGSANHAHASSWNPSAFGIPWPTSPSRPMWYQQSFTAGSEPSGNASVERHAEHVGDLRPRRPAPTRRARRAQRPNRPRERREHVVVVRERHLPPQPVRADAARQLVADAEFAVEQVVDGAVVAEHERERDQRRVVPVRDVLDLAVADAGEVLARRLEQAVADQSRVVARPARPRSAPRPTRDG